MIHLLSSFPTSMFTGLLVFCLTWWLVTSLLGGGHHAGHAAHAGHAGAGHAGSGHAGGAHGTHFGHASAGGHSSAGSPGHAAPPAPAPGAAGAHGGQRTGSHQHGNARTAAGGHHYMGSAFATSYVPLPLAFTVLSAGAWAVSLLLQFAFSGSSGKVATATAVLVLVAAIAFGFLLLRIVRRPFGTLYETEFAPGRHQSVGATCKIRTLVVNARMGDAEVLSGPTKGSLIQVRAEEGRFTRGDIVLVVDYDEGSEAFQIDELDELFHSD